MAKPSPIVPREFNDMRFPSLHNAINTHHSTRKARAAWAVTALTHLSLRVADDVPLPAFTHARTTSSRCILQMEGETLRHRCFEQALNMDISILVGCQMHP